MRKSILLTSLLGLFVCGPLPAQEPVPGDPAAETNGAEDTSLLGAKQQRIKRLMNDLESKFTELASKLREEQPDQAKKLENAFKQSKQLLLMQRMDQISALLDAAKLESATDEQGQVVGDLKALIDLLLYEESEYERLQREIEQLEKWKESLEGLIKKESELQEDTEILEDPKKAEEAMDAKIQKTKDLIKKQEDLLAKTEASDGSDVDALDKMADEQAELRKETKELAKETDSEGKVSAALSKAANSQRGAEKQLGQAKPKDAASSEKKAIEEMKKALKALEQEKEQLAKMAGEEAAEKLSEKQSETAGETDELAQEMSEGGEPKEGEDSPAASVQKAQEEMNQAAQQLGQNQAGKAGENQEKAQEELEKAKEEVERQLNELRDQAQEEQIAKLAEVFQKMLEKQRGVTGATKTIAERRGDAERLRRADRIELRKWAKEERSLEEDAKAAEQLLVDDGTSIVFRDVVGYLQTEIANVSEMMERQQTGSLVREAHIEIETTLQELVTSLENTQMGQGQPQPQQPQQGGQPQPQRQSLFPPLAELKLLRLTQQRINRQTTAMEMGKAQPEVADLLKERFDGAAEMQNKLTNMTRQLATQLQPTMTQEDPNAID